MDLSLESTFGLAPGVAAWLIVAVGAGHGLGLLPGGLGDPGHAWPSARSIGALNALLIVRFGLNGFIVTLGMLIVLRGLLTGISGGQTFFDLPRVDALPRHRHLARRARRRSGSAWLLFAVGIVVLGYTRLRPRRCTPSAATSTRPGRPASAPTGCCGSS